MTKLRFPKIVFSDFDGTLTKQGKFSPVFFDVLEVVQKHKSQLVVVTGRPLSWAHFLLTHFDLNCVITEGGGMISMGSDGHFLDSTLVSKENLNLLNEVTRNLLSNFKDLQLSADSGCRRTDRAIELSDLENNDIGLDIDKFLQDHHINFSRSNVHLNFWAGEVSKKKAIEYYLNSVQVQQEECMFIGDSLNDESAFQYFDHSVGVSNISDVKNQLKHPPKIILEGKENEEIEGVLNYLRSII